MHTIKKHLYKILLILILMYIPVATHAFSSYSANTLKLDRSLNEQKSTIYVQPEKIYVTQISTNSESLLRNPSKWVKSLYYFTITRLHFSDLPYTYLLDENGLIYQTNDTGVGSNPALKEKEGAVTIGYLSNNPVLTKRASESLKEMVEEISSQWGISVLETVKLYINQEEGKLSTVTPEPITGEFSNSVKESISDWKGYSEENHEYKVKIEEVVYDEEIEIGERVTVNVKIKNINDFIWFTQKDPIYISTADGKESSFAINKDWESFSRPISVSDKDILPGESVEMKFELEARVLLGEAEASFVILKFENQPFGDSQFDIKFAITKGERQLVEIASPRYSFVNIRDCRWYSCEVLDTADNGEVFIYDSEEEGWTKIQYGIDEYGWVNSAYLKKI